jgi:hypothetical protein
MSSDPDDGEPPAAAPNQSAVLRRHLLAALAAPSADGVPPARKVVDALIARACEGDLAAIREIFDRADGKSPPAPAAPEPERKVTFAWKPSQPSQTSQTSRPPSSTTPPAASSSASTSGPSASPAS